MQPSLMWTLDDGAASHSVDFWPVLLADGMVATTYVITANVGTAGHMSLANLYDLYAVGWDVGSHTANHLDADLYSDDDWMADVAIADASLAAWGFERSRRHLCYPAGSNRSSLISRLAAFGMLTARATYGGGGYDIDPATVVAQSLALPDRVYLSPNTTLAAAKGCVDAAIAAGHDIIVTGHRLVAAAPATNEWTVADFTELVAYVAAYVAAGRVVVRSMSNWYALHVAPTIPVDPRIPTRGIKGFYHAARADAGLAPGEGSLAAWMNLTGPENGTVVGTPAWTGDGSLLTPRAFDFDGVTNRVDIGDLSVADDNTWTYWCWARFTNAGAGLMGEGNSASGGADYMYLTTDTSGYLRLHRRNSAGTIQTPTASAGSQAAVNDGRWHLLGASCDGATMQVWVDGQATGTPLAVVGAINVNRACIGARVRSDYGVYLDGEMAAAGFHSVALTAAEWLQLFTAGSSWPTGGEVQPEVDNGPMLLAIANVQAAADTIAAKTVNLPADPAAVGSAMILTSAYDKAKDDVLTPLEAVQAAADAVLLKTNTIGALAVTVTSPVAASGTITVYSGDDYASADSRAITVTVADSTHALGLDGAVVKLKATQATWDAASVVSTTDGYTVTFEATAVQTAAVTRAQHYELEATLANGHVVTLAKGSLVTRTNIPAVV